MLTYKCLKKIILKCENKSLKANFNLIFFVKYFKSHAVAQVVYALLTQAGKGKHCAKLQTIDSIVYIFPSVNIWL